MAKQRIIPLFIPHAGCPNACVFCDQVKITGASTPVTPEMVRTEIEKALPQAGRDSQLAFYGGSFTALPWAVQQGLLAAAQPYLHSGALRDIRLSTRPDAIDDEICRNLREYGVSIVELGCQSLNEGVLLASERGHTAEDTEKAVECLKGHGFSVILQMMTGLPGDHGPESMETAERIIALRPDGVRIYPTVVLRGTKLETMMKAGSYSPQGVEEAVELCARLYQRFLQADIPVIRLGLNPTEELSGGEAVAGAYHPALGELVLARMYLRRAEALLKSWNEKEAVLSVHPRRISVMVGQKRENLRRLRLQYPGLCIKVVGDAAELWEITLKKP